MIPLVLTASEVLAYHAGTLAEIRRPIAQFNDSVPAFFGAEHGGAPEPATHVFPDGSGKGWIGWWTRGPMTAEETARCYPGNHGVLCPLGVSGDVLFGQEVWRSWEYDCEDAGDEHRCDEHCVQTYVAYAATPRVGYRPIPDKARITYLDESTPLDCNRKLLGPWEPAETMPEWAARIRLVNRGVRVERGDVWTWCVSVEVTK